MQNIDKYYKMTILASFQKSGNTWVNFILANLFNLVQNKFDEIDFHNIHGIIPELNVAGDYNYEFLDMPMILRTHLKYGEHNKRSIVLLRNPFDVMYSYYHYLNGERKKELSLAEVVKHPDYGIKALVGHNESYLRHCDDLLIITYEKLKLHSLEEMMKITSFLQFDVQPRLIKKAIELSSFENMRRIELKKGRRFGSPDFIFTRSGKIGEGISEIKRDTEVNDYILEEIKKSPVIYLLYG